MNKRMKAKKIIEKIIANNEVIVCEYQIGEEPRLDIVSEITLGNLENFTGVEINSPIYNLGDFEYENNIDSDMVESIIENIIFLYDEYL